MEFSMKEVLENITRMFINNKIYLSIIIIVLGIILYKIIERTINKILDRDKKQKKLDKKGKTMVKLFTNIAKYIILLVVIVLILQIYGINVNSLVAGLGIVSVIAGLAIQDPLKDIITGINIISDDYFSLGDIVNIDGNEGKVIQLGIRTTKLCDIKTGNIHVIANRNINKVTRVSEELYIDVPLSYEDKMQNQEKILIKACEKIEKLDNVKETTYLGLNEFADSALIYKIKILCKQEHKYEVKRQSNKIIKQELDQNNMSIPYPQITIHNSNTKNS